MTDLNEMWVFTKVAQTGSFTAAAQALGMPKSSVSRKVSSLEDRIGARLLQRTTRKLGLTDMGRIYFEHGQRVVAEMEEAELAVGRMRGAPCGRLRVTTPLSFAFFAPLVGEFLVRYPEVQLDMVCTDRNVDLVGEGFDLGIRAGRLQDSSLIARPIGELVRVLVAAPSYLRKHGTPKKPSDLREHDSVCFGAGPTPDQWQLFSDEGETAVTVASRLVVNDFEMLREACRSGVGIGFMPAFMCAEDLRQGSLAQVLPAYRSPPAPLHVVYPSTRHLAP
jgi:DNA-binding transcriptional LysR family regulator